MFPMSYNYALLKYGLYLLFIQTCVFEFGVSQTWTLSNTMTLRRSKTDFLQLYLLVQIAGSPASDGVQAEGFLLPRQERALWPCGSYFLAPGPILILESIAKTGRQRLLP